MVKDEFKVLKTIVDSIQKNVDRIDRDMGEDRKEWQNVVLRLGNVENGIAELLRGQHTTANKVKDAVEDAMDEAVKPIIKAKWKFWKGR